MSNGNVDDALCLELNPTCPRCKQFGGVICRRAVGWDDAQRQLNLGGVLGRALGGAQAIVEIAKLLAADAKLKVYVVGHTDNVGTPDANMRLSQEGADAVVQALVRTHGIAAARLKSFGGGPYSPVASNDAEAGRAKNRRVELVEQ